MFGIRSGVERADWHLTRAEVRNVKHRIKKLL